MNNRLIMVVVIGLIALALIYYFFNTSEENTQTNINNSQNTQNNQTDDDIFDLTGLDPDTKVYVSDRLGIRFRYDAKPVDTFEVLVTERDNKIYLHGTNEQPEQGKVIEVFDKDANVTLEEAIKSRFLANRSPQDCYVTADSTTEPGIVLAIIDYPPPTSPDAPFWENSSKCPQEYAKTNAVQYFMMDNDVTNKYIFLRLGQDSITSDGSSRTEEGGRDWSASVEIFK